jgi:putative N6-adenine-specific DNA methylase
VETKRELYIAKTFAGLEPLLEKELLEVGAEEVTVLRRAVSFTGDRQILYRANIWCRTALSILKQIHSFSFDDKDGFYEQMRQFDWPGLFDKEKTFTIIPIAYNTEVFNNTMYLAQLSKDAVADCFTDKFGSRPNVDSTSADIRINVHVQNKQCSISLDSSGEALFKRGYRKAAGPAPINEILAAGLIMLTEWDMTSPFIDPMCGSGTFSIEAAMMSANIAPAVDRKSFGFSHWPDFDAALLKQEQEYARSKQTKIKADIIASDIHGYMLDHARRNVMNAGFMGSIKIQKNDFFTYRPPYEKGWVILNPPYGVRMLNIEVDKLHEDIGEALKHRFTGFRAGIITSEIAAMRHIGLKPSSKTQVYNGPLECSFNVYDLFAGKRKARVEARSAKPEGDSKRSEEKEWKTKDRNPGPEDRGPRQDDRKPRPDYRRKTEERYTGERRQRPGDRDRKTEDRDQGSDDRKPRPDYRRKTEERYTGERRQRPGNRDRKTEDRDQGSDDRKPRPDYRRKTEERYTGERRQRPGNRDRKTEDRGQGSDDRKPRPDYRRKTEERYTGERRQRPGDRDRKTEDRGQGSDDRKPRPDYRRKTEERYTGERMRRPGDRRTVSGPHKPRE